MSRRSPSSSVAEDFERVETARLVLRRPVADDIGELHRIHADERTWEHSPESRHSERRQSDEFLRRWTAHWDEHGFGYWTVLRERDVIGFGGIWLMRRWQGLRDVLNVYYRFDPAAWGRGYATEMVDAAVVLAARHFPGVPLVARVKPENEVSARVAIRSGFERRDDLDELDLVVYARGFD